MNKFFYVLDKKFTKIIIMIKVNKSFNK